MSAACNNDSKPWVSAVTGGDYLKANKCCIGCISQRSPFVEEQKTLGSPLDGSPDSVAEIFDIASVSVFLGDFGHNCLNSWSLSIPRKLTGISNFTVKVLSLSQVLLVACGLVKPSCSPNQLIFIATPRSKTILLNTRTILQLN